jgi:hypothetical protein
MDKELARDILRYGGMLLFFAPVWGRIFWAMIRGKPWTRGKALKTLWTEGLLITISCMVVGLAMYIVGRFVL